jgi:hypothetical protein
MNVVIFREEIKREFDESKKALEWRVPPDRQSDYFYSKFKLFMDEEVEDGKVKESFFGKFTQYTLNPKKLKQSFNVIKIRTQRQTQLFIPERHEILGNDLAAAHFLVFRGGKVKFVGGPWIKMKDEMTMTSPVPNRYDPNFLMEAVDCEGVELYFEGLENLRRLKEMKCISFRGIKTFDDWCLDRVSGSGYEKLEVLDLSDTSITHLGLQALYRMTSLRKLMVTDPERSPEWQVTLAMLCEIFPNLEIVESTRFRKIPGFPLDE